MGKVAENKAVKIEIWKKIFIYGGDEYWKSRQLLSNNISMETKELRSECDSESETKEIGIHQCALYFLVRVLYSHSSSQLLRRMGYCLLVLSAMRVWKI